jgi:hypothetical protein
MKTNSLKGKNSHSKGNVFFAKLGAKTLNKIAKQSGYLKKKGSKIDARSLIIGFMMMISKKMNTYEAWASETSVLTGETLTRQAVEGRMTPATSEMLRIVLEEKLKESINQKKPKENKEVFSKFRRIMIEDSTTLRLPDELSKVFSGNVSRGKKKSQAKIHALHNFTENNFSFLDIHSFTNNDQSLAYKVLDHLREGDLLLRDMGFLVQPALKKIISAGVYVISRKNAQTKIYDTETGQEIDLAKELRKTHFLDKIVVVGKKEQIKMRIVALPVSKQQANERKRKAKNDRDKRLNHNKEYYELLGYVIYITNIPQSMCVADEICKLYGLRWRIEIIFKSWKSCFSLEKLIPLKCRKPQRIYSMIYLFLLFILLFHVVWLNSYNSKLKMKHKSYLKLSLLKMAKFFIQHFCLIIELGNDKKMTQQIILQCCYDSRNDRLNTMEKYEKIAA